MRAAIERHFRFAESGAELRTEVLAGLTTFLTMSYIVFANPQILGAAGMPVDAVITATCLSAGVASILMGVYDRLPVGLAPGMGTNAYFAYYVCGQLGLSWQTALGAVFISGGIFLILTLTGVRERIIEVIPNSMKHAIAGGIGIFIAFVGMKEAGIIVDHPAVFVAMGDLATPGALVTLVGLVVSTVLMARRVPGALLLGIFAATAVAIGLGVAKAPTAIFSLPPSLSPLFLELDIGAALGLGVLHLVFAFVFVDLFDTVATLIAVGDQGGLLAQRETGETYLPGATRALTSDAIATMVGALFGTSTVTSYIESTSGIAQGGRTGLVAVVTGLGFFAMLFVSPLVGTVPPHATAPALIIVAVLMFRSLGKVHFDDLTEAVPAVLACIAIPLTFSISNGLALGFISYPIIKVVAGRGREVGWLMYLLGAAFVAKFLFLST